MFAEEWPLMMFTLLTQLGVGTFILLTIVRTVLESKENHKTASQLTNTGFLAIGVIMAIALVLSLFHLGTPSGAYRALSNIGSSWLSREILFVGIFFVLILGNYFVARKGQFNKILSWVTALTGIMVIFSMASIYSSSIRPAWDSGNTLLAFLGTTFLFGALASVVFIIQGLKGDKLSPELINVLKKISMVGIAALLIQLVYLPVYYTALSGGGDAALASAQTLAGSYAPMLVIRWVLSVIGAALLVYALFKKGNTTMALPLNTVYLAFALVLVGEFLGRYIFYASAVSIMVG